MAIGIDFGSREFRVAELQVVEKGIKYRWRSGGIEVHNLKWFSDRKVDVQEVKKFLNTLWAKYKIKGNNINTSLTESEIYSRTLQMPPLSDYELNQALKFELEQYLPLAIDKVYYSFTRLGKVHTEKKIKDLIFVVAVRKEVVDKILALSVDYNLVIDTLETAMSAISRSVSFGRTSPVLIADLGYNQFSLAVAKEGQVFVSRKLDLSGLSLNRLLAKTLNVDQNQAEEIKNTYGLDKKQLQGKLVDILSMPLSQLVDEAKRLAAFFEDKILAEKVKEMIMVGGGAALPGLSIYLSSQMNMEISLPSFDGFVADLPDKVKKEPHLFAQTIGSAIRQND